MSETKTVVLNLRVTPAVMMLLEARAAAERRPVRSMAAMLLEDVLSRPRPAKPVDPEPAPKPPTDADREYRRKLLTGAINPKKGKRT